jgi:hypothetical protein
MAISRTLLLALCSASAATLPAQTGTIGGPVSGYVFDARGQSLRVLHGIPGAALVGGAVDLGVAASAAWVSPRLDSALVIATDGTPHIYQLDSGKAVAAQAEGLVAPERAVYSPSGSALALVTPGSVRIYKGLPGAPTVAGTIELPADLATAPGGMAYGKMRRPGGGPVAVSDDGLYLLYGNNGAIQLLGVAGDSRTLTDAAAGALPVFAPGGHDAAVIDAQTIALFQDAAGAATVRRLPGVSGVRGGAFSPDGKRLFLASATVTALDLGTGDRASIACDCRPAGLIRMGTAYRLNDLGTGPLWLLDASGADPRIVFVPAAR